MFGVLSLLLVLLSLTFEKTFVCASSQSESKETLSSASPQSSWLKNSNNNNDESKK